MKKRQKINHVHHNFRNIKCFLDQANKNILKINLLTKHCLGDLKIFLLGQKV